MLNEATSASLFVTLGEIRGGQNSMAGELSRVGADIIRMAADQDSKHAENRREIAKLAADSAEKINRLKTEVNLELNKINRQVWVAQAFVTFLSVAALLLGLAASLGWQPLATEGGYRYERPSAGPLAPDAKK